MFNIILLFLCIATTLANTVTGCCEKIYVYDVPVQAWRDGLFTMIDEMIVNEHPVYINENEEYLYYWPEYSDWRIGNNYSSATAGIRSNNNKAGCPELFDSWSLYTPANEWTTLARKFAYFGECYDSYDDDYLCGSGYVRSEFSAVVANNLSTIDAPTYDNDDAGVNLDCKSACDTNMDCDLYVHNWNSSAKTCYLLERSELSSTERQTDGWITCVKPRCSTNLYIWRLPDVQWDSAGYYTMIIGRMKNQHPVYRNEEGKYLYYWSDFNNWQISDSVNSASATVRSVDGKMGCPETFNEWHYRDGSNWIRNSYTFGENGRRGENDRGENNRFVIVKEGNQCNVVYGGSSNEGHKDHIDDCAAAARSSGLTYFNYGQTHVSNTFYHRDCYGLRTTNDDCDQRLRGGWPFDFARIIRDDSDLDCVLDDIDVDDCQYCGQVLTQSVLKKAAFDGVCPKLESHTCAVGDGRCTGVNCVLGDIPGPDDCDSSTCYQIITQTIVTPAMGTGWCSPSEYYCRIGDGGCTGRDCELGPVPNPDDCPYCGHVLYQRIERSEVGDGTCHRQVYTCQLGDGDCTGVDCVVGDAPNRDDCEFCSQVIRQEVLTEATGTGRCFTHEIHCDIGDGRCTGQDCVLGDVPDPNDCEYCGQEFWQPIITDSMGDGLPCNEKTYTCVDGDGPCSYGESQEEVKFTFGLRMTLTQYNDNKDTIIEQVAKVLSVSKTRVTLVQSASRLLRRILNSYIFLEATVYTTGPQNVVDTLDLSFESDLPYWIEQSTGIPVSVTIKEITKGMEYSMYKDDDSNEKSNTGLIVGIVVGCVAAVCAICVIIYFCQRNSKVQNQVNNINEGIETKRHPQTQSTQGETSMI